MSPFKKALQKHRPAPGKRRWFFVPYDQLSDAMGPLAQEPPGDLGIVLVENPWKAARRPYHKQKLALILANLRHFALEQAKRGVAVCHVVSEGLYRNALDPLIPELGEITVMLPAERELRADLQPLAETGKLKVIPHEGWLTRPGQFHASSGGGATWRMDAFYRRVRRGSGILMSEGKPMGGRFSFDGENRLPWNGDPIPPKAPTFPLDAIKEEVGRLVNRHFPNHPGRLDLAALPSSRADAERLWSWALEHCLPFFGPFEDAMSSKSKGLFHTRISALLNIHRILPRRALMDAMQADIPLPSKEAFVRQVLGWREFVHHVHDATDGFRGHPGRRPAIRTRPGDGGYAHWSGRPWTTLSLPGEPDGGAAPSFYDEDMPVPPAYWGERSGLACLDAVISQVWDEGYSHHITRLMILTNIASLLDVSPREITDWFWAAYLDAYDWVVEPNVLAMGTYAVGDLMTTKPYVSGAAYIHKMSDYCGLCAFNPRANCPLTRLYWAYLARHRRIFEGNPRMNTPLASLKKRPKSQQNQDRAIFRRLSAMLTSGETVEPETLV